LIILFIKKKGKDDNNTSITCSPSTTFYDIESDSSDYTEPDEDDDDGAETDDDLMIMSIEEQQDAKYLAIFQNGSENFDNEIMSVQDVNALKKLEQSMMDRTDKGYYRCKIKHEKFYKECKMAIEKYITPGMLAMLQHNFSTQKNESLNHSVATLAPKGKDYSKSSSLKTRVMLVAGAQIVGHYTLWKRIFTRFQIVMDDNLARHLQKKDANKEERQIVQKMKEYKVSRSTNRYAKFAEAHRSQLEDTKTGAQYESGVAVKNAKKTLKDLPKRNPKGTQPSEWKCRYHHVNYCTKKGHKDARSVDCCMYGKSKQEQDAVVAIIMEDAIQNTILSSDRDGK